MSKITEIITETALSDNERFNLIEQDRELIKARLDDSLKVPDLTDSDRTAIILEAVSRTKSLIQSGGEETELSTLLDKFADLVPPNFPSEHSKDLLKQARSYFACAVFEEVNLSYNRSEIDNIDSVIETLTDIYFDPTTSGESIISPDANMADLMDIARYAQRSEATRELTKEVFGEIIIKGSQGEAESLFVEQIIGKDPIEQLEMVNMATSMAMQVFYLRGQIPPRQHFELLRFSERTLNGFGEVLNEERLAPFVDLAIRVRGDEVYSALIKEYTAYDLGLYENEKPIHTQPDGEAFNDGADQAQLHERFPAARDGYLQVVADGAVVRIEKGIVADELVTLSGKRVNLTSIAERNDLGFSEDEAMLLRTLYHPYIRIAAESELGLTLNQLPIDAQRHLLTFMVEADPEQYRRLIQALDTAGEHRLQFANAFLAAEYGKDFRNVLLDLAESTSSEELNSLLEQVQSIRERSEEFALQFEGFDDTIAGEIQSALAERVTEILYVAKAIALSDDGTASKRVLGRRITATNLAEVTEVFTLLDKALMRINRATSSQRVVAAYDGGQKRSGWSLGEKEDVLLQLKSEGDERGNHVAGVEHSEEAQINYSADVISEDGDRVPISIADYRRRYALSIRIDLEGMIRDKNGGITGFDATREQLVAALDIGSLHASKTNPNYKVASIISLGRKIRSAELGKGGSRGYHTTLSARYGEKGIFKDLVEFKEMNCRRIMIGQVAVEQLLDPLRVLSSPEQLGKVAA